MTFTDSNFTSIFVGVPGNVIGGWVGFGIFTALLVGTLGFMLWAHYGLGHGVGHFLQLVTFSAVMMVVYLLAANEQFVVARTKRDAVNMLMTVANAGVWMWGVIYTAGLSPNRPSPVIEKYARVFGWIGQALFVLSVFVRDGVIYALWALALAAMFIAIGHYGIPILQTWPTAFVYSKQWLAFAIAYTIFYAIIAFLSHLYLAIISLSGAVWAYLTMHLLVFAWLVVASKVPRDIWGTDDAHPKRRDDISLHSGAGLSAAEAGRANL